MSTAYYNEFDPKKAEWLRELIASVHDRSPGHTGGLGVKIFVCRECGCPISDDGLCSPRCENDVDLVRQRPHSSVAVMIYQLIQERPYDPTQDGAPTPAAEEPKR